MSNIEFSREIFKTTTELSVCKWIPKKVDTVAILVHGMAEHAERYNELGYFFAEHNIALFANDLRGHGQTAKSENDLGYFGKGVSFLDLINDEIALIEHARQMYPNVKTILMGHSMGSFLAQGIIQNGAKVDGAIILSTGMPNSGVLKVGRFFASVIKSIKGENYKSKFLDNLVFSKYQDRIENPKTKFDWLSRDEQNVQKYINDPLCGFLCSASFFYELMSMNAYVQNKKNITKIQKDLHITFFAGTADPLGEYSKGIKKLANIYRSQGLKNVTEKYYEGARHELLNETNNEEVKTDLLNYIQSI